MKIPILTNIFQRGWNHQLVRFFVTPHLVISNVQPGLQLLNIFSMSDLGGDPTAWKFNISSQNQWLEDEISFWNGTFFDFQGGNVVF